MSILIKGMEMPQGCIYESNDGTTKYCPMCDNNDVPYCKWLDDDDAAIGIDERPCYCPLVEVKEPHGRLIDADALHDAMYHRAFETDGDTMWQSGCWVRFRAIEQVHESQPTIIEAEGSK